MVKSECVSTLPSQISDTNLRTQDDDRLLCLKFRMFQNDVRNYSSALTNDVLSLGSAKDKRKGKRTAEPTDGAERPSNKEVTQIIDEGRLAEARKWIFPPYMIEIMDRCECDVHLAFFPSNMLVAELAWLTVPEDWLYTFNDDSKTTKT